MNRIFAFCKSPFALCILLVLALGALNLKIQYGPVMAENSRHEKAEKAFNQFWETEGAENFRKVGVEPTEKIYQEELADYMKKFEANNPTLIPEKRIAQMKEEFREWWERAGKKSYAANEIAPDENLYQKELKRYIHGYTKDIAFYQLVYIPETSSVAALFTSWFLFPGVASFLLFALAFLFAMKMLEKRWGYAQTLLFFVVGIFFSGFIFAGTLSLTYFVRYAETPFTGMSLSIALLLGMAAFGPKREVPKAASFIAIFILALDVFVNWNANPDLYGWVSILEIPFFALGALLGKKVPKIIDLHKKSSKKNSKAEESVVKVDPRKVLRNELKDAIDLANKAEYDHASQIFAQKFGQLFRENPLDAETIEKVADAMLYPHFFFTIPGIQWMAWGSEAEKKGLSQIAVNLFEKGVSVEKDPKIRRRGLFYAGDLRLRMHLYEEKAKSELEEVLQLDSTDILANEVHKLLGK